MIYMANCEACHLLSGENVIKPKKPIPRSTKLESIELFREFLSEKHGAMPNYSRLAKNDEALAALYRFTKTLKKQSWEYREPAEKTE